MIAICCPVTERLEQSVSLDPTKQSNDGAESNRNEVEFGFSELLADARSGNEDAIGMLWEQCRNYLLAIANRDLVGDVAQKFGASDVVQQSLMIANEKPPEFKGKTKGEFLAWMKQIVVLKAVRMPRFERLQKFDNERTRVSRRLRCG